MFDYFITHTIKNSVLYTRKVESADIFLISTILSLYYARKVGYKKLAIDPVRKLVPYFDFSGGVDFVLLQNTFASNKTPFHTDDEEEFPGMTSLGDLNWEYSVTNPRESLRNTVTPYSARSPYGSLSTKRNTLVYFIGTVDLDKHHGSNLGKVVRSGIQKVMQNYTNSLFINTVRLDSKKEVQSYGWKVQGYMRNSSFCIVPHGDSPSSKRFIDAIQSLCIPIVLSDMIRFPFEDVFIDYSNFVIHVPMMTPRKIHDVLEKYDKENEIERRQREMMRIRDIFFVNVYNRLVPGQQAWAWAWLHYIKMAYVKPAMRRSLLKSIYV